MADVALFVRSFFRSRFKHHPPFRGEREVILIESEDEFPRAVINDFLESKDEANYVVAIPDLVATRKTPNRLVYQLAHEMCHFYLDPFLDHPFVEVICVMASLAALEEAEIAFGAVEGYFAEYRNAVERERYDVDGLRLLVMETRINGAHIALASRLLTNVFYDATENDWTALLKLKHPKVLRQVDVANVDSMFVDFDEWESRCDGTSERATVRSVRRETLAFFFPQRQQRQQSYYIDCMYHYCTIN